MPTYEYKCDACGTTFERFQSMSAAPVRKCPKCGKNKVRRLISAGAGLIFKGSGFYITDYRDKSYTDSAKADTGGGEKTSNDAKTDKGDKTDAKTETKPETKASDGAKSEPAPAKSENKPPAKASKSASKSGGGSRPKKKKP